MESYFPLLIVWVHWLADFVCQSDAMAKGKSSSNQILAYHVVTYSFIMFLFFGWQFALVNGLAHFATDWCTSRVTKSLWAKGRVHDFFVVIGVDQALHLSVLLLTIPLIGW